MTLRYGYTSRSGRGLACAVALASMTTATYSVAGDSRQPSSWVTNVEVAAAGHDIESVGREFEAFIAKVVERRPLARSSIPRRTYTRLPRGHAWWRSRVRKPIGHVHRNSALSLQHLLTAALKSSHQLDVFSRIPAIRETGILEAQGRYRPEFYAELKRERTDDPANSFGQAQGFSRKLFTENAAEVGLRSRLKSGAEVGLSHRRSRFSTNASEYDPKRQGRGKSALTLVQPFLRNGGFRHHNRIIRVAELDADVAMNELVRQAEQHLLEIVRAYWTLYRTRASYLQKKKLAASADRIVRGLRARSSIDVDSVQVSRARSAAASRIADLLRAKTAIKNAELRLKSLINSPSIDRLIAHEIITRDVPSAKSVRINRRNLLREALQARPELRQAFAQYRATVIREGLAWNEALPQLDLILEGSYHTGNNEKLFRAPHDKNRGFGFAAGVRFSVPLGEDERKARYRRRRIETSQQESQVRSAIETVALELEVSVNEYEVSRAELQARYEVLRQAQSELRTIRSRWVNGRLDGSGLIVLTELLDAQERLQKAEENSVNAEVSLAVSRENLKRARGGYLEDLGIEIVPDGNENGRKKYQLIRNSRK